MHVSKTAQFRMINFKFELFKYIKFCFFPLCLGLCLEFLLYLSELIAGEESDLSCSVQVLFMVVSSWQLGSFSAVFQSHPVIISYQFYCVFLLLLCFWFIPQKVFCYAQILFSFLVIQFFSFGLSLTFFPSSSN